jgi:hypothetical protein
LQMYGNPVLWSEGQQLTGDSILIYMADSAIDHVHVPSSAFVIQEVEPGYYNQLGGNDLKAYFKGENIEHIDIDGNAESIYYLQEKDSTLIGRNYSQSSYLSIWFNEEGQMARLVIWPQPKGQTIPVHLLTQEDKTLKNFEWFGDLRPIDRHDIFRFYKPRSVALREKPGGKASGEEEKVSEEEQDLDSNAIFEEDK